MTGIQWKHFQSTHIETAHECNRVIVNTCVVSQSIQASLLLVLSDAQPNEIPLLDHSTVSQQIKLKGLVSHF